MQSIRTFFSPRGRLGRVPWVLAGVAFFLVKYVLDYALARLFQMPWSPWNYLEPSRYYNIWNLPRTSWPFYGLLVFLSVPFIAAGIILTVKRLRDAALPQALALFFFVPMLNLLFFMVLALFPPRWPRWTNAPRDTYESESQRQGSMGMAVLLSAITGIGGTVLSAQLLRNYGWGLFIGVPFMQGLIAAAVIGHTVPQTKGRCIRAAVLSLLATAAGLIVVSLEGIVCIAMALPAALPLAMLGGAIGYLIQRDHEIYPPHRNTLFQRFCTVCTHRD